MWRVTVRGIEQDVWGVQILCQMDGARATWAQADPIRWDLAEHALVEVFWDSALLLRGLLVGRDSDGRVYRYQADGWGVYLKSRYVTMQTGTAGGLIDALVGQIGWLPPVLRESGAWDQVVTVLPGTIVDGIGQICRAIGCTWWVTGTGQVVVGAGQQVSPPDCTQIQYQISPPPVTRVTVIGHQGILREQQTVMTTVTRHPIGAGSRTRHWSLLPATDHLGGAAIDANVSGCMLVRIAGTGVDGFSGDGGPAINAQIGTISALCHGPDGTIYVATNDRVRRIDTSGIITTIAGTGTFGTWAGLPAPATTVDLGGITAMTTDSAGNVYCVSSLIGSIYRIDITTGILSRYAGTGTSGPYDGSTGDPATIPLGFCPQMVWAGDTAYIVGAGFGAGFAASVILRIAGGVLSQYGGGGSDLGDDILVSTANLNVMTGIGYADNALYIGQQSIDGTGAGRIRRIDLTTDIITTIAGATDEYGTIADLNGAGAVGSTGLIWAVGTNVIAEGFIGPIMTSAGSVYAISRPNVLSVDESDGPLTDRTIIRAMSASNHGILAAGPYTLRTSTCIDRSDRWLRAFHNMTASGDADPVGALQNTHTIASAAPSASGSTSRTIDFSVTGPLTMYIAEIFWGSTGTASLDLSITIRIGGVDYYTNSRVFGPGETETLRGLFTDISSVPRMTHTVEIISSGTATGDLSANTWGISIQNILVMQA